MSIDKCVFPIDRQDELDESKYYDPNFFAVVIKPSKCKRNDKIIIKMLKRTLLELELKYTKGIKTTDIIERAQFENFRNILIKILLSVLQYRRRLSSIPNREGRPSCKGYTCCPSNGALYEALLFVQCV